MKKSGVLIVLLLAYATVMAKAYVICNGGTWTKWYNRDRPSANGDYELLSLLRLENPGEICATPSDIDARIVSSHLPWFYTGQVVSLSPYHGLSCINAMQPGGRCANYEVRFCCRSVSLTFPSGGGSTHGGGPNPLAPGGPANE